MWKRLPWWPAVGAGLFFWIGLRTVEIGYFYSRKILYTRADSPVMFWFSVGFCFVMAFLCLALAGKQLWQARKDLQSGSLE